MKKEKLKRKKYVNVRSTLDNRQIQNEKRTEGEGQRVGIQLLLFTPNLSFVCLQDLPGQKLSRYFAN